jgi:hypothetical protein
MTLTPTWAPTGDREKAAQAFRSLVDMARADGPHRLDELIGPRIVSDGRGWVSWMPGELTHSEVRAMLVEATAMSFAEPRVMELAQRWRANDRADDAAIRMEADSLIAEVGADEIAAGYWLKVLTLGWVTHLEVEAAVEAERRAIRAEMRRELRTQAADPPEETE